MQLQTITKEKIEIEKILIKQKQNIFKSINEWRKKNKKYFKGWDSTKTIRILRESNGRP
jgi:hypothetical protein